MALVLAIETATKLCSVALGRDGAVIGLRETDRATNAHAEKVNVFIAEILGEAGLTLGDLHAVAAGVGPGSYTGLRIGLSAAKGLCYALDIPIIGLGTLDTLVEAARGRRESDIAEEWPMIDARRMEVFTQPFNSSGSALADVAPLILDEAWAADSGTTRVVYGDGADKAAELWSGRSHIHHIPGVTPTAKAMIAAAERRFRSGTFDDLAYLVPAYGKAANVTQPKKRSV